MLNLTPSGIKLTPTGVKINTNLVWTSHNTGGVEFNTGVFAVWWYCYETYVVAEQEESGCVLSMNVDYHLLVNYLTIYECGLPSTFCEPFLNISLSFTG